MNDAIDRGERALAAGEWEAGRAAFEEALAQGDGAAAHDGLGRALWWLGEIDAAVEQRERAFVRLKDEGRTREAAGIAVWLAREHLAAYGNDAVAGGWLARAERLLDGAEVPERGWLLLVRARRSTDEGIRAGLASDALTIAAATGDADLEVAALAEAGLAEIEAGRVAQGLDRLDEAMAAATGGETAMLETLAQACCSLVAACDLAGDAGRLEQWARIVEGFVRRRGDLPLLGFCRTCSAQMLVATGRREEAEREFLGTIAELGAGSHRSRCVDPAVKLAELRLLQGRYEEAGALLEGREGLPEAVVPASELDVARGEPALAVARLLRRLNRVGRESLLAPPLLAQLAAAQIARGDLEAAGSTSAELTEVADASGHPLVAGYAAKTRAGLARAREEPAGEDLELAVDRFTKMGVPLEVARARLALAIEIGVAEPDVARDEAMTAEAAFRRLGADHEADAAAALVRDLGGPARTGAKEAGLLTRREREVLHLLGEGLSNAEIAARLYISTKTAGHHVSAILAKLGLENRAQAAAYVVRLGEEDRAPR